MAKNSKINKNNNVETLHSKLYDKIVSRNEKEGHSSLYKKMFSKKSAETSQEVEDDNYELDFGKDKDISDIENQIKEVSHDVASKATKATPASPATSGSGSVFDKAVLQSKNESESEDVKKKTISKEEDLDDIANINKNIVSNLNLDEDEQDAGYVDETGFESFGIDKKIAASKKDVEEVLEQNSVANSKIEENEVEEDPNGLSLSQMYEMAEPNSIPKSDLKQAKKKSDPELFENLNGIGLDGKDVLGAGESGNVHQESLDDCIIGIIREENPQLFQYIDVQLKKYSTTDTSSVTRILQLIGLSFYSKNCSNIQRARAVKHDVIAILENDRYCIIKDIKDGFVDIFSTAQRRVVQRVKLDIFEKLYTGQILLIKNIKGSGASLVEKKTKNYWFWRVINRYKAFYVNVLVAAFIINLFGLIIPLFAMNVYDRVIPNNSIETLWALASGVLIIIVFDFILKMMRAFFVERTSKQIDLKLSNTLFAKALHLFMKDQVDSVGVRASKIKNFDSVRDFLSSVTLVGVIDFPFLVITMFVIYYIGGLLVIIPFSTLVLAMILTLLINIPLHKHTQRSVEGMANKNSLLFETLFNIETVKNFCMQPMMMNRWDEDTKSVSRSLANVRFLSTFIVNFTSSLGFLSSVLIVVLGTHLILDSDLTTGGLIACSILSGRCLAPIAQMTTIINRFQQVRCSLDNLNNMMMLEDERRGIKEFYSHDIGRNIELHNMSFAYEGQGGEFFENATLTIKAGEKVALLGNSGSGKTTLFKLVSGLYAPNDGSISLSGVNIQQIDPYILRSKIGYVEQSARLFKGTLWSNIIVKNPKASEEDIMRAIEISGVNSFAKQHPDGYNMTIEEAGNSLSGGQVQSIVLARALIDDPQILLLDEPTNFMDSRLENNFIRKLRDFSHGRTLLVSTHKRALLELVDRVIVIDEGKIVADNRKDVILNKLFK